MVARLNVRAKESKRAVLTKKELVSDKSFYPLLKRPYLIGAVFFFLVVLCAVLVLPQSPLSLANRNIQASLADAGGSPRLGAFPIVVPNVKYGFALDTFQVSEGTIRSGQVLGDLLASHKLDYPSIQQLVANAKPVFEVRELREGKPFMFLSKDTLQGADYFIYEPNVYEYLVFDLKKLAAERIKRPIITEMRMAEGTIKSSLWQSMQDIGASPELFVKMEDALQWSIDFRSIQEGDGFKIIYEQNFIDGEPVGVGMAHAAYYQTANNQYFAFYHETEKEKGYYDELGRPMNKGFLKSPIKSTRISSYFNLNRFHPILKRVKPHLGTDYAAPTGTPIYAVGDGVIVRQGYTNGNGNFIKIKHDDTYQTQYLHMSRFAKGMAVGVHVKQGDVIGYVGSTGLATGPHVCFRFWKNGRQVNHLRLSFPPPDPLPEEELPAFYEKRDAYLAQLGLELPQPKAQEEVTTPPAEEAMVTADDGDE